jgi:uncharacterized protein (TIGR02646 family)
MRVVQRKSEPLVFSEKQFLGVRADIEEQISTGKTLDFKNLLRLRPIIRELLLEEFQHQCAYCDSTFEPSMGCIDHFYPKYLFPQKALQWNNLILACQVCNATKHDKFPVDSNGNPLLIFPGYDNPIEHLKELDDGQLEGITEKGRITIELLKLNRPYLVESRKKERLYQRIVEARPDLESALFVDDFHKQFVDSISNARKLNKASNMIIDPLSQPLRHMLYANVITCLETYLSDAFINTVKSQKDLMRRFVETFHGFRSMKFNLTDIFACYESIDETAIKAMGDVIYHDLSKVSGMYKDALGVEFPRDVEFLYKAVRVRHDIVHRNGKEKSGNSHSISAEELENLISQVVNFVEHIQGEFLAIKKS